MPKGLFPSTCQACLRQHSERVVPVDMLNKFVSVNMPKECPPSMCQNYGVCQHAKNLCPSTCQNNIKQRPIVSESLNLETSATRLVRVLLVFFHKTYTVGCILAPHRLSEILSALFLTIHLAFYRAMSCL